MFYSTIGAEVLRISRVTTSLQELKVSVNLLLHRMYQQGANKECVIKVCTKMLVRYQQVFDKYNIDKEHVGNQ